MRKVIATIFGVATTYFIYNQNFLTASIVGAITIILILTIKEK